MEDILDRLKKRQLVLRGDLGPEAAQTLPQAPPPQDALRTYVEQAYVCPPPPPPGPGAVPGTGLAHLEQRQAAIQDAFGDINPSHYPEIQRILALPVSPPMGDREAEEFSRQRILAQAYLEGFRLFPVQAQAVRDFEQMGGLLAPIGVGWGKTLVTLMIAESAYRQQIKKSILFVPPQVYPQLVNRDIGWARHRIPLSVPFTYLGKCSSSVRMQRVRTGRLGCYVMPYSLLSSKDAEDLLAEIWPDLLIFDEAHLVKNQTSARTRRILRFMRSRKPRVAALSGTITSKSIMDYHHLLVAALQDQAPIPVPTAMATEWGSVVDAMGGLGNERVMLPLVEWSRRNFPSVVLSWDRSGFRSAYRMRLNSAPGVVATSDAELGVSLTLANRPAVSPPEKGYLGYLEMAQVDEGLAKVASLMSQVESEWLTPDGDEIDYGIHMFKWMYELSAGFYYSLRWPTVEDLAQKTQRSLSEAEEALKGALAHHASKQDYSKMLRQWLANEARHGLDTPLLVASDMAKFGERHVGHDLYKAWTTMKDLEFDGMPERFRVPVPVSDYKVRDAVEWAKVQKGGTLIWYHHQYMGEWVHSAIREAGGDSLLCVAGDNEAILDPANEGRIIVASTKAHGTGKNLQAFQNTLLFQFPREAVALEQTLGRNHRQGQKADELIVATNHTIQYDYLNLSAALNDALYTQQTTAQRQKAVYAGYDPLPVIFPYDVLVERGFKPRQLDSAGQRELVERFSPKE